MGLLESASFESRWRGYDYFKEHKVLSLQEITYGVYAATVQGNTPEPYTVELHLAHPRTSTCNCPHANGRRVICKHIVAAYFTALPGEADRFYQEAMEEEEKAGQYAEDLEKKVISCVGKMKKAELQQALLDLLMEGPDWQYDRFVRDHDLGDW